MAANGRFRDVGPLALESKQNVYPVFAVASG